MPDYGAAIDKARDAYSKAMPRFMPDTCAVSTPGAPAASRGQITNGPATEIDGVPCRYEGLSTNERVVGGALIGDATHAIELPVIWEGAYLHIPPTATIRVAARGLNPAITFAVTGALPSSSKLTQRVTATQSM